MDISSKIRKNLKEVRLKKKMSHGNIAKLLGVHSTYISQIERGVRNPTMKNIEKIAKVLNISIQKLLK